MDISAPPLFQAEFQDGSESRIPLRCERSNTGRSFSEPNLLGLRLGHIKQNDKTGHDFIFFMQHAFPTAKSLGYSEAEDLSVSCQVCSRNLTGRDNTVLTGCKRG
jgi:hypothetical protein